MTDGDTGKIAGITSNPLERPLAPTDEPFDLDSLFRRYSSMVFRICLRYTKNREEAEDMVSEVFMKVGRSINHYRGDSKPMVWIYRIAVNQSLDFLRTRRSKRELELDEADYHGSLVVREHGNHCLAKITLERILGKINPVTRQCLFLSHMEGLTHNEIAGMLGVSRDAVTKKLNRFSVEINRWVDEGVKIESRNTKQEMKNSFQEMIPEFRF